MRHFFSTSVLLLSRQQLRRQPAEEHRAVRQTVAQLQRPRPLHQRRDRRRDLLLVLLRSGSQAGRGLLHLHRLRHREEADQGEGVFRTRVEQDEKCGNISLYSKRLIISIKTCD